MQEIKRGDVWYADLGQSEGSEQRGVRPVLIIQNDVGNTHSPTVIVASMTDATKRYMPTHHTIQPSGKLYKSSVVLLEQIRTVDKRKLVKKITDISEPIMEQIDTKMKISLGLTPIPPKSNQKGR